MSDFYVKESEYRAASKTVKEFCDALNDKVLQYYNTIRQISEKGVSSGELHDALIQYMSSVNALNGRFKVLGEYFSMLVDSFIQEVISADTVDGGECIYEKGEDNRDYTDAMYSQLISCLDDPWCSITDDFGDWLIGLVQDIFGIFNIDFVREILGNNHKLLLEYLDVNKEALDAVFHAEWSIDAAYKARLESFFNAFWNALEMIRGLSRVMTPLYAGTTNFTVAQIDSIMGGRLASMQKSFQRLGEVKLFGQNATLEQIGSFAENQWSSSYFDSAKYAGCDFMEGLGIPTAIGMTAFQMFDIAKETIAESALHLDELSATKYNELMIKKELAAVLSEEMEKNSYTGSEYQEGVKDFKTYLKYLKDGGDAFYDHYNNIRLDGTPRSEQGPRLIIDGRTKEAKQFRSELKGLKNAGKILKYGDQALEYTAEALADYSKGLEVLDSLERNYAGDEIMTKAIQEIRGEYEKQTDAMFEKAADIAANDGVDALEGFFATTPVGGVVATIEESIDIVGEASGLGTRSKAAYSAMVHNQMQNTTEKAYVSAVEKLREANESGMDHNSEEYIQLAEDVRHCFSLNKNNTVEMFQQMADASTGEKRDYFRYCMKMAERMDLRDSSAPDIVRFDEYQKGNY